MFEKKNTINLNSQDQFYYSSTFFIEILPNMSEREKKQ